MNFAQFVASEYRVTSRINNFFMYVMVYDISSVNGTVNLPRAKTWRFRKRKKTKHNMSTISTFLKQIQMRGKIIFFSQFPHVEFNELSQISVIICCNFYSLSRFYKMFTKRKNGFFFNSYRVFFLPRAMIWIQNS